MDMVGESHGKLTAAQVEAFLTRLRRDIPRPECWSCECLQGFLARLELDATEGARSILVEYKRSPGRTHSYPGCESCPPAAIFAEYLMHRRGR
jgi:hypothetical protein